MKSSGGRQNWKSLYQTEPNTDGNQQLPMFVSWICYVLYVHNIYGYTCSAICAKKNKKDEKKCRVWLRSWMWTFSGEHGVVQTEASAPLTCFNLSKIMFFMKPLNKLTDTVGKRQRLEGNNQK